MLPVLHYISSGTVGIGHYCSGKKKIGVGAVKHLADFLNKGGYVVFPPGVEGNPLFRTYSDFVQSQACCLEEGLFAVVGVAKMANTIFVVPNVVDVKAVNVVFGDNLTEKVQR